MNRIIVVKPSGEIHSTDNCETPTLEALQEMVGGYLELLYWPTRNLKYKGEDAQYYVDEEGLLKNMAVNLKATEIVEMDKWQSGSMIVGNLVILTGSARSE